MPMDKATLERLRFRRQFLFGPRAANLPGEWLTHPIGTDWVLSVQRDLPVQCAPQADGAHLALLGFVVDPQAPELNNRQLFQRLCQCRDWQELLRATTDLSGRWALFHREGGRVRVVNDATGLRSVYYSVAGQEPWCFSQPGLYRRIHPVEYLREAVEFIGARECQRDWEACFPAASSPYAEVAHLLPNHYLDLNSRKTQRFWPTAPLERMDLAAAVAKAVPLFQQSMQAITARGRVAFAVTAGRDSRTLLAASRAVKDRLLAHTAIYGELNRASPDLRIGTELCRVAGLDYHPVACPRSMTEPFKGVFMQNHDPAHRFYGRICQGLLDNFPADTLCVRGNISEVARCVFYPSGIHPATLTGSDLAQRCKMPVSKFTCGHFEAWLADAAPAAKLGYNLLDLFFCEHRMAKWQAVAQTQYDIIYDTFSPYSNRRLINVLIASPPQTRIKPQCTLYHELIRAMWPELSPFPFNPPESGKAKLLHKLRKAGRQLGGLLGWHPIQVRLEWPGSPPQTPAPAHIPGPIAHAGSGT